MELEALQRLGDCDFAFTKIARQVRTYWASRKETVALDELKQCVVHNFDEDLKPIVRKVLTKAGYLKQKQGSCPRPSSTW